MRRTIIAVAVLTLSTLSAMPHTVRRASAKRLTSGGLAQKLRSAGLTVRAADTIRQPFFSVKARVYVVAGDDLQVYEYRNAATARRESSKVSPDGGSIGTSSAAWMAPPHFFRKDRLIAIYIGSNADVLRALGGVMGPQFAGR